MTEMVMERAFNPSVTTNDVMEMAVQSGGCFSLYRVDWNQSFLTANGRDLFCWLTAPDAESARMALRQADVGEHVVWPGTVHDSPVPDAPPWQEANVLVSRSWDAPVDLADIQAIEDAGAHCLEIHNVQFCRTIFSTDRKRMICLYKAPDAESVRNAQRQAGMPMDMVHAISPVRDLS